MTIAQAPQRPPERERRDVQARDARDRLAVLLRMEPGDLRRIGAAEARSMIEAIEAARAGRGN